MAFRLNIVRSILGGIDVSIVTEYVMPIMEKISAAIENIFHGEAYEKKFTEKDANPKELAMGIKVEMEHTPDPALAKKIALDHLAELPDYYTRLAKMEREGKKMLKKEASMELQEFAKEMCKEANVRRVVGGVAEAALRKAKLAPKNAAKIEKLLKKLLRVKQ